MCRGRPSPSPGGRAGAVGCTEGHWRGHVAGCGPAAPRVPLGSSLRRSPAGSTGGAGWRAGPAASRRSALSGNASPLKQLFLLSSLLFSMQFAFRAAGGTCLVLQPRGSSRSPGRGRWHRPLQPQVLQALCPNFLKGSAVQFPNVVWERHEN